MKYKATVCILILSLLLFSCADEKSPMESSTDLNAASDAGDPVIVSEIRASSFFVENELVWGRYHPVKVLDKDPLTAWNEAAAGAGTGEWLEIVFAQNVRADAIKIMPGYFDPEWFDHNNRIKRIAVHLETADGNKVLSFDLDDGMNQKTLDLGAEYRLSSVKFVIWAVYNGTEYDDTCISEVRFLLKGEDIKLDTALVMTRFKNEEETRTEVVKSPKGKMVGMATALYGEGDKHTVLYFFEDFTYVCQRFIPDFPMDNRLTSEYSYSVEKIVGKWKIAENNKLLIYDCLLCSLDQNGEYTVSECYGFYPWEILDWPEYIRLSHTEYSWESGILPSRTGISTISCADCADLKKTHPMPDHFKHLQMLLRQRAGRE